MVVSNLLKRIMGQVYMAPADDTGGGGGGADNDRGDDFVPTGEDAPAASGKETPTGEITDADKEKIGLKAGNTAETVVDDKGTQVDDDKDGKKGKGVIPVDRHQAILNKEREARQRAEAALAQQQRGQQQVQVNEKLAKFDEKITDLEGKQMKAIADGDTEKAMAFGREMRQAERERASAENEFKTEIATANAVEAARYNMVVERIEEAYPAMNPDHEDYDEDVVEDVLAMKSGYERRGMTPSAALQKAVQRLLKPETRKQTDATEVTPRVDKDAIAKERKADAVKKAVETDKKQPPSTAKTGENSDKLGGQLTAEKVIGMSQKEFDKLTEEQLSALRGDEFVG